MGAYLAVVQRRLGSRLRFTVTVPPELESFRIPPGMLITLVENAIKHGIEPYAPGGEISLTAAREDGRVAVTVADTGAGLCAEPGQGSGSPTSASAWACFAARAPVSRSARTSPGGSWRGSSCRTSPVRAARTKVMTGRPTAIIAEDEELMRTRLCEALAAAWPELAIVSEVGDGDAALAAFDENAPSVAFLDIRMPGMTGLEVAAEIGSRSPSSG